MPHKAPSFPGSQRICEIWPWSLCPRKSPYGPRVRGGLAARGAMRDICRDARMAAYDYLVVGCGMFGAVFARLAAEAGRRVLLVDKRGHVAGNCYSQRVAGIEVHRYGPHIFHTDNESVWRFVTRFAHFNHYRHRGRVAYRGREFSFPLNLATLEQVWGVTTSDEAERKLQAVRVPIEYPRNLRVDAQLAKKAGADLIFAPKPEEMYPEGYRTYPEVENLSQKLCGQFRPGHFKGVATVVLKLFNLVRPDRA